MFLYVAGNENSPDWAAGDDPYRFGKDAVIADIKYQGSLSCKRYRLDRHSNYLRDSMSDSEVAILRDRVKQIKQNFFADIIQTEGKITVVLDAHGLKDGTYLIGGYHDAVSSDDPWNRITPEELADAFNERDRLIQEKIALGEMVETEVQPFVAVFHSCDSYDQMRSFYNNLSPGVQEVYAMCVADKGQVGYSSFISHYGSKKIMDEVLQIEHAPEPATIGGSIKRHLEKNFGDYKKGEESSSSWYAPDKENRPIEISRRYEGETESFV